MTAEARVVVDASVVVKWYVPESGSGEAVTLLEGDGVKLAPDLLSTHLPDLLGLTRCLPGTLWEPTSTDLEHTFLSLRGRLLASGGASWFAMDAQTVQGCCLLRPVKG